jgi:hypothetical protein
MLTIDNILLTIEQHGIDKLNSSVPVKDRRILKNLVRMIQMPAFITESQGRLLIKILQENMEALHFIGSALIPSLKNPSWTKSFKTVEIVKQISISKNSSGESFIDVECSFNKEIKKSLTTITRNIEGSAFTVTLGKRSSFLLTEKNLYNIVKEFDKHNFDKSEQVIKLYNDICSLDLAGTKNSFNIYKTANVKLKNRLIKNIGVIDSTNMLLLEDRKIEFQYTVKGNLDDSSLANKIAKRTNNKIFINSSEYTLLDVAQAIRQLRKMPALCIFDEYDAGASIKNLKMLKTVVDAVDPTINVGAYFRFNNSGDGEQFNKLVSEYGFNKQLDNNNRLSIIANGKIPKFFLKSDWYPKTVVSFSNHFRNNKTSVYCNSCDLIVYYTSSQPMIGTVDVIV